MLQLVAGREPGICESHVIATGFPRNSRKRKGVGSLGFAIPMSSRLIPAKPAQVPGGESLAFARAHVTATDRARSPRKCKGRGPGICDSHVTATDSRAEPVQVQGAGAWHCDTYVIATDSRETRGTARGGSLAFSIATR
jgi:hypothetical protein